MNGVGCLSGGLLLSWTSSDGSHTWGMTNYLLWPTWTRLDKHDPGIILDPLSQSAKHRKQKVGWCSNCPTSNQIQTGKMTPFRPWCMRSITISNNATFDFSENHWFQHIPTFQSAAATAGPTPQGSPRHQAISGLRASSSESSSFAVNFTSSQRTPKVSQV